MIRDRESTLTGIVTGANPNRARLLVKDPVLNPNQFSSNVSPAISSPSSVSTP
jgi:hypothetical protein